MRDSRTDNAATGVPSHDDGRRIFVEDRDDVVSRALPRAFVGTYVLFQGLFILVYIFGPEPGGEVFTHGSLIWVPILLAGLTMMICFDIWAYRWGRRIRYVIDEESLQVFRADKLKLEIDFSKVRDWADAASPSPNFFWLGQALYRHFATPSVLDSYGFLVVRSDHNGKAKWIYPPMLFRWRDRGGVEDVSAVLWGRLGKPVNRSEDDRPRL